MALRDDDQRRLAVGTDLIREAGALAMDYHARLASLTINSKGVQDVVSEADVAVEELIRRRLSEQLPGDGFLGEETGHDADPDATGVWVIDPIDGTVPFVNGLSDWCVSMGYVRDDRVVLGLVFAPQTDELFLGGPDLPSTLNGRPIAPHPGASVSQGLTYLGASNRLSADQVVPMLDRLLRADGMFVRSGSGALGLCGVACGRLIGYIEPHINSWDCAGAIGVLNGAGARVSDFLASPDALTRGNWIVAGPADAYDELRAVLGDQATGRPGRS